MTDKKTHTVFLTKTYAVKPETILNLFRDNTVFKLTGANDIESDFKKGGAFRLTFNNRGTIYGQFIKVTDHELVLEWNVTGFQRRDETKTIVEISLGENNGKCRLTLYHKNIVYKEAANAKKNAWTEILEDIEHTIPNR